MRTIWKYALSDMRNDVLMPQGGTVRHVAIQGGRPTLWAEVDSDAPMTMRHFRVFGTGFQLPRDMGYSNDYIGTVHENGLVWHVYEQIGVLA
jgi:hypothetical protein